MKKEMTASQMGKLGGSSRSEAKRQAAIANGKKGGRPKKVKENAKDKPKPNR